MSLHEMSYIPANRDIPYGMVTSTARKGDKWMKAQPGDTLELYVSDGTEREFLGNAIVTKVELVNYVAVLHRAKENHVVQTSLPEDVRASEVLEQALAAAYGPCQPLEPFTIVHFIRVNP